jgi:hypothetical protein
VCSGRSGYFPLSAFTSAAFAVQRLHPRENPRMAAVRRVGGPRGALTDLEPLANPAPGHVLAFAELSHPRREACT